VPTRTFAADDGDWTFIWLWFPRNLLWSFRESCLWIIRNIISCKLLQNS